MSPAPTSLIRMANQIAANFVNRPDDEAAKEVADHLRMFWAPSMRTDLMAYVEADGAGVVPVVMSALGQLRTARP